MIPQVDTFGPDGYTGEESKIMLESRKIMGLPDLPVSATCVRVPVDSRPFRRHQRGIRAARLTSRRPARPLLHSQGPQLVDDPSNGEYPTPLDFSRVVKCGVGRIRDRHGPPQRSGILGERRQPLEGGRPQRGSGRGVDDSGRPVEAQDGARGRLIGTDA